MPKRETLFQLTGGLLFASTAIILNNLSSLLSVYFGGLATALIAEVLIDWTKQTTEKKPRNIEAKLAVEPKAKTENNPEFFRKIGPLSIDFREGYFATSHDVDNIKNKLMKEGQIMIHGPKGSGKSFLLRNLGYKLYEDERVTFLIELKEENFEIKDIVNFFAEKKNVFLLIDDAHLNIEFCEGILSEDLDIRIAFTCRHGHEDLEPLKSMAPRIARLFKDGIKVDPKEIGKRIVNVYLRKNGLKCSSAEKKELFECSNDLWALSKALTILHEKGSLQKNDIYKNIEDFVIQELQNKYGIKTSDSILFIVANFSKYDIDVEREYVEEKLKNKASWVARFLRKNNDVGQLIRLKEIREYGGMLKVDSVSMAELYLEALKKSRLLACDIKEEFNGNLELKLFMEYIRSNPKNLLDMFIYLGGHPHKRFSMMRTLIEDKSLINIILRKLKSENDIKTISWFLFRIARINSPVRKEFLKSLKINDLLLEALSTNDIIRFHFLSLAIKTMSKNEANKAIRAIPEDRIITLYNNCEKIGSIEPSLGIMKSIDRNITFRIISNLEKSHLVKLLDSESNLGSIRSFFISIQDNNEELSSWILKHIKIDHLVEVIDDSNKCGAIASFLGTINNRNPYIASEIYSKIDKNHLVKTIFDSNKAGAVDSLLFTIRNINTDNLDEIVKRIWENLPEMIDSNKLNAQNIEGMVSAFSSLMPEMINSLFKEIGARGIMKIIDASTNKEITHLIETLNLINSKIGREFEEIFRKQKSLLLIEQ